MTDETLHLRTVALEWKQIDDEVIALDTRRGEYLSIEGSALLLWHALVDGTSRANLIGSLTERYGIDAERAARDVDAFIADMAARDLLA